MTSHTAPRRLSQPIDSERWPDVAAAPNRSARAAIARLLFGRAVASMPVRVELPDGRHLGTGDEKSPTLYLIRPDDFYQRLGATGLIGFGEAFMAGDFESDDLADFLTVLAGRMSSLVSPRLQKLRSAALRRRPSSQDNTIAGARENIHRHYDLSNELFALFLDESMTYSSALFADDPDTCAETVHSGQHRKIDRLLDTAGVSAGSRVLEIGTGWGELAIRAAGRGADVLTVTISQEQATLARDRVEAAGVSDRVEVRLQDYRDVTGQFDSIVSVEMIEAVGVNHWNEYFGTLDDLLVPGGKVGLQAITMPHDRMLATVDTYTWIVKYIFPGGHLSSIESVREQVAKTGLTITTEFIFGRHYAETLRRWRAMFEANADEVIALGFDEVFCRMWSLYLAYSEAGFRSRYLDVVQFGLMKPVV